MGMGGGSLACPNCRQPFIPQIEQIIDVGRDPTAKARFLSGQSTTATCPNCGFRVGIASPLLYHDPEKELFLVYVPMELGLQHDAQERLVGRLVKTAMDATPAEKRRGYMFQPRSVLSLQGMMEAVLQADGVTPEMLEAQRAKVRLVETLLQSDEDALPELVRQYDDQIDVEMFEIITVAAQNALQTGREDMARHALATRDRLMELSTAGKAALAEAESQDQAVQDVVAALEALGDQPTPDDFVDLVIGYAGDDLRLQALVGLQFPLFDYSFFQALTGRIERVRDGAKADLTALRDRLLELTEAIKQQQQAMAQAAVGVVQDILNAEDIEAAVRRNLPRIDDTFMMVLSANIERAGQNKDLMLSARLKQIYETVMKVLQENVPPEIRFVSSLLQEKDVAAARALIDSQGAQFGPDLVQIMDSLVTELENRGDEETADRLRQLRQHAATVIG
jgi:hypothetical protein